ncbi:MAG: NTP transferase domain-containing protein, partial [Elusimicrobiaceae bacterium]|nr:NTP transferase domain-containing protein [Elusimicrobiaceae bacterium]
MGAKNSKFSVLIVAAGKGTRMKSMLPKSLQPLAGQPIIAHILQTAEKLSPSKVGIVVSEKNGLLEKQ